jgi:3-carboxy-cis,cis-muconate cycloisomerase
LTFICKVKGKLYFSNSNVAMSPKSAIFSQYLSDDEMEKITSDKEFIRRVLEFEIALAKEQSLLEMIPQRTGEEIGRVLPKLTISPEDLRQGTLVNGVPVLPLLELVKERLSPESKKYLHFGATSQDAMDTAMVLMLREALGIISERLTALEDNLSQLHEKYGNTPCMARTRGQLAVPITFGHKIDAWLDPLKRHQQRLTTISKSTLKIQLGGAAGDRAVYHEKGEALSNGLASALQLSGGASWHAQRDGLCELTNWLAIISSILGKMGADILVLAQSEINEVTENAEGGGKSSAMPHKNNPILSEALVALAKLNAGLQSQMLLSLIHTNERDATAWILEWSCVPQMLINTGTSLRHAIAISKKVKVNTDNMRKNVERFKNQG